MLEDEFVQSNNPTTLGEQLQATAVGAFAIVDEVHNGFRNNGIEENEHRVNVRVELIGRAVDNGSIGRGLYF